MTFRQMVQDNHILFTSSTIFFAILGRRQHEKILNFLFLYFHFFHKFVFCLFHFHGSQAEVNVSLDCTLIQRLTWVVSCKHVGLWASVGWWLLKKGWSFLLDLSFLINDDGIFLLLVKWIFYTTAMLTNLNIYIFNQRMCRFFLFHVYEQQLRI